MTPLTRDDLCALDADDPLAPFRARFRLPDGRIYVNGNSLGPLPRAALQALDEVVKGDWGKLGGRAWGQRDWLARASRVGARVASLIGAAPDEVIIADSTSINLYKMLMGALSLRPGRRVVLTEAGNFPTDRYIIDSVAQVAALQVRVVERPRLEEALTEEVAVVALTHVDFRSGARHDMAGLNALARHAGALTLWDLSHSAGAIEVDLAASQADLAVGCTYKFLNGGPGAPAFLYVARRHQDAIAAALPGWMGHADPFAFAAAYRPADGIARHLSGTPPILALAAMEPGIAMLEEAGIAQVAAKSARLGDLLIRLVHERLETGAIAIASPMDARQRGAQVSLRHPRAAALVAAMEAMGVIADYRPPDLIRFGLAGLYLSHGDMWEAVAALTQALKAVA
ncbi:MAG: kynureninase [Pseudomonadota bacterium]